MGKVKNLIKEQKLKFVMTINIFTSVFMYDNSPDSILKELSKRDEQNKNFDGFGVLINPFNDGQIEYNILFQQRCSS